VRLSQTQAFSVKEDLGGLKVCVVGGRQMARREQEALRVL
jgi:hypothetical protein